MRESLETANPTGIENFRGRKRLKPYDVRQLRMLGASNYRGLKINDVRSFTIRDDDDLPRVPRLSGSRWIWRKGGTSWLLGLVVNYAKTSLPATAKR